jgi:UDP-N-acetylmuramoylalanine--D-glutamate ligase
MHVIIGLGATGLSCARYLKSEDIPFAVIDTRESPPHLEQFKKDYPDIPLSLGAIDENLLDQAGSVIISPGLSVKHPAILRQISKGTPVIGDIELFALKTKIPTIAITGTNAKSTVTTLVYEMAKAAGFQAKVGGNLGTPALDLLNDPAELFVLELSSFQLETTFSLKPTVASVLNVTPDHMDRYPTFEAYANTKKHIYSHCGVAVCNRDDPFTDCENAFHKQKIQFTLNTPREDEFGLIETHGKFYLAHGTEVLLPVEELPILGRHFQANALAALAIGYGFGLPKDAMLNALKHFKGLPHRVQRVRERQGVLWYNDSKGTNVGATLAAIEGFGGIIKGKLILIAGGVGKNADFSPLIPPIKKYVKTVILIGEDANIIAKVLGCGVNIQFATSMFDAVQIAAKEADAGDCVLLSPASASFDMFKNFEHRGNVFMDIVNALPS